MHPDMIELLQEIRDLHARPMFISSGYRCEKHPVESMKELPGEHTYGLAVDIICHGAVALDLIGYAQSLFVSRIGMNQKGRASSRFIHLGLGDRFLPQFPHNALWTY